MTKTAMIKERNSIWEEYIKNRDVYENKMVEKSVCHGFGDFAGTGIYTMGKVWVGTKTMKEWDIEKATRYEYLNTELAEYEAEKARKAKIRRYEKELAELREREAYLEKWLAENK